MTLLVRRKHFTIDWGAYSFSSRKGDYRKRPWRFRHNRRVHNVYAQVGPLEVVVWYR